MQRQTAKMNGPSNFKSRSNALKAREAWNDLVAASEMLESAQTQQEFRVIWVSCITLVRAVGHILKNADGAEAKAISDELFDVWKANRDTNSIFWEFIKHDRDLLLKEYDVRYVDEGLAFVIDNVFVYPADWEIYCPIPEGRYAGEDCRDVLQEAIDWWDEQLSFIEAKLEP